jgi:hypothetical protein
MSKRITRLDRETAERAIYIDFEGTAVDSPSFLGAAWSDGDTLYFRQLVLELALWPAAEAKSASVDWFIEPAGWESVGELRALAEDENRVLIAWSSHEAEELGSELVPAKHRDWFATNVINGIPIAKRWKRATHPNVTFAVDPKHPMRGKNQLSRFLELIDYHVPKAYGPGNSAKRIRDVREMLNRKDGDYAKLTPVAKAKWTKALLHNWHDCVGLRALMIECVDD